MHAIPNACCYHYLFDKVKQTFPVFVIAVHIVIHLIPVIPKYHERGEVTDPLDGIRLEGNTHGAPPAWALVFRNEVVLGMQVDKGGHSWLVQSLIAKGAGDLRVPQHLPRELSQ